MDYDVAEAIEKIELDLIKSMQRNMNKHIGKETNEKIDWTQWQAEMLQGFNDYKRSHKDIEFKNINEELEKTIKLAYESGKSEQEIKILEAIKKGAKIPKDYDGFTILN